MKKLKYVEKYPPYFTYVDKLYANQFQMAEKINEIIDWLQPISDKRDETLKMLGEAGYFTNDEFDVIKKCLRYCSHRLLCHSYTGIHSALSQEDKKIFNHIYKNL